MFLAGSIEQGAAPNWQSHIRAALSACVGTLLNPRRADWDATWAQDVGDSRFREQVEWELSHLERADQVAVFFAPGTKAPITLLELGLFAASGRLIVACPKGYWRKGNVDIVCARYGVRQVADLEGLVSALGSAR